MNRTNRRVRGADLHVRLGAVGYDAAGPSVELVARGLVLRARPAGAEPALVGYHLSLLGLGVSDPAARVVALALQLETALPAAEADLARRSALLAALAPLSQRLIEFADKGRSPAAIATVARLNRGGSSPGVRVRRAPELRADEDCDSAQAPS